MIKLQEYNLTGISKERFPNVCTGSMLVFFDFNECLLVD